MIAALALALVSAGNPGLPALLTRLRLSVPDARSITDLQVCPATRVSDDGASGTTMIAFNRPREPRRYYRAVFKDGAYTAVNDSGIEGGADGLAGLASSAMEKRMAGCPFITAAQLHDAWAALDGGAR
ncbi:MAG: hypothetical protein K2X91_05765 [Thermoleophilia bacterium]|nr:hypothetical protein [Thermoleophilia bacterium]